MNFPEKILIACLLIVAGMISAQQSIDNTLSFQTDPAKKYSIYVPSGYDETPTKMMVGLHPYNTSRWNARSWRDTLIHFAEANNLLLICPDGGADGRVDDAIDTAFTTLLIDSMQSWYNVDQDKIYAMGFSWGGKTTYTYGLSRPDIFAGYIPIGSAVNGAGEVSSVSGNANGKPMYIVHGANDSPSIRFTPLVNEMESKGAVVNSLLMSGVGHTIDFPNRNEILSTAFEWVDSVNCQLILPIIPAEKKNDKPYEIKMFGNRLQVMHPEQVRKIVVYDISGKKVQEISPVSHSHELVRMSGVSLLEVTTSAGVFTEKRRAN